jgi:hypothetical protein
LIIFGIVVLFINIPPLQPNQTNPTDAERLRG